MLSNKQKYYLLISALEGGSNYWYFLGDLSMIPEKGYSPKSKEMKEELEKNDQGMIDCLVNRVWEAVQNGAEVPVFDAEDPEEKLGVISKKSMANAVKLMIKDYPNHLGDVLTEQDDAETGDVFLQLAVMGDIVFG